MPARAKIRADRLHEMLIAVGDGRILGYCQWEGEHFGPFGVVAAERSFDQREPGVFPLVELGQLRCVLAGGVAEHVPPLAGLLAEATGNGLGWSIFVVSGWLGNAANVLDIETLPGVGFASQGAGSVHHIAFAVENRARQLEVREALMDTGFQVTPVIDRDYFWAIYFRTPGGVLFEVATNEPETSYTFRFTAEGPARSKRMTVLGLKGLGWTPKARAMIVMSRSGNVPPPAADCSTKSWPNQMARISSPRFRKCLAGSSIGLPPIRPDSLPKAMTEPEKVTAPIRMPR